MIKQLILCITFAVSASGFIQPSTTNVRSFLPSKLNANIASEEESTENNVDDRRKFLSTLVASSAAAFYNVDGAANAADGTIQFENFVDKDCNFKLNIPSSWETSTQELPDRRKIKFFVDNSMSVPQQDKTLVFIAYTPVRDDFTSLGSFGSVENVAQTTILPKGKLMDEKNESGISSKMILAESKKNAYMFDYMVKVDGTSRHFRTIFALASGATGGAGSVLVTITAQALESEYSSGTKDVFDAIIDSYGKA